MEIGCSKWVLFVTEHFNIDVNSVHSNRPGYNRDPVHSGFSQTHKIGNIGIIVNFEFPYI